VISEFFMQLAVGFLSWIGDLFPVWTPPTEFRTFQTIMSGLVEGFVSVGVWIPWSVIGACFAVQVVVWGLVFAIKGLRAAAAHVPMIGGAGD
jgi:hypothetical protein